MNNKTTPIFCDECSALALVSFDDRVLCARCLAKALRELGEDSTAKIEPLDDSDRAGLD